MTTAECAPAPFGAGMRLLALFGMLLMFGALAGCSPASTEIYRNLDDAQATRLVALLEANGLQATKVSGRDGVTVTVPKTQLMEASSLADRAGLPRSERASMGTLFKKDGLISSPLEERARMMFAVAQQIEAMLMDIEGVTSARVNVVIPEVKAGRPMELPSAAVLIRYTVVPDEDLLVAKAKQLVIASVPGLAGTDGRRVSVELSGSRAMGAYGGADPREGGDFGGCTRGAANTSVATCRSPVQGAWNVTTLIVVAAVITVLAGLASLVLRHPTLGGHLRRLWPKGEKS